MLLPASLPGYLAGLRQGWAFSWRSLMAAELIVTSTALGFGLGPTDEPGPRSSAICRPCTAALILIFLVGVGIEMIFFRPLERSYCGAGGLTAGLR